MPEKAGKVILERERERGGEREIEQNEAGLREHGGMEEPCCASDGFSGPGFKAILYSVFISWFLRFLCIVITNPPHAFWFYLR